jgi:DNA-binding NarL/FixJ family response regulator
MNHSAIAAKKKILVVEDHPLFRAMLVQLIEQDLGMSVCGHTNNLIDALILLENTQPDAAIVDLTLSGPGGLELIKEMKARCCLLPVLVLSMHGEELYAERALRAGAKGYISKEQSPKEVATAIRTVVDGGIYVSKEINNVILRRQAKGFQPLPEKEMDSLSDRELEVFELIGAGLTSREISERLKLVATTVDSYRARIKQKLSLKNAAELYQRAALWLVERKA